MKYDNHLAVLAATCYIGCILFVLYIDIHRRLKKQPSRLEELFTKSNLLKFKDSDDGKKAFIEMIAHSVALVFLLIMFLFLLEESRTMSKFFAMGSILHAYYFSEKFVVRYKIFEISVIGVLMASAATIGVAKVFYDPVDFRLGFIPIMFSLALLVSIDYNIKRYLFLDKN